MELPDFMGLPPITVIGLFAAIMVAVAFEAVNGFHDAANAVATVIYTNSLSPRSAVLLSGVCNFFGVYLGGVGVAFAIVHLLPVDLLVNVGSRAGLAMIFAILIAATTWNLGTWYRGIPASSSHTLIGAIVGVGMANSLIRGEPILSGMSFGNVEAIMLSLLISPLLGFALAAALFIFFQRWAKDGRLYGPPHRGKPPVWVRSMLLGTSVGVSLAHGSNDGQKGVGLVMIILIGIIPSHFALNPDYRTKSTHDVVSSLRQMAGEVGSKQNVTLHQVDSRESEATYRLMACPSGASPTIDGQLEEIASLIEKHDCLGAVSPSERSQVRRKILMLEDNIKTIVRSGMIDLTQVEKSNMNKARAELRAMTDYAPGWVILMVATAIGLGTMIGWERVVVTVGEKIGRIPLNYAQGVSSQTVAMVTIGLADMLALPVSTTHALSSGVTGSMVASGVGLKYATLRDIAMAWILTLPVTVFLSGTLFLLFLSLVKI
jgi:phosphate/sulfate permease